MKTESYIDEQAFAQIPEHEAEPFAVYRDGTIDEDWLRAQKRAERIDTAKQVGTAIVGAVRSLGKQLGDGFGEVLEEWDAYAYDQRHGTEFHKQLLRKRREERNAKFAARIGLQ